MLIVEYWQLYVVAAAAFSRPVQYLQLTVQSTQPNSTSFQNVPNFATDKKLINFQFFF